ncbi:hypothetical protein [Singulisphaera acidiphila]|uniref:DUF4259 domain-containing protein n=1 Tax=Singulisphaera acidiphila (strain ATCC BAA-1392 / DSM 18658 / VKM B-2454 / MOB10) TaxID=886293 RepID=L0D738_SINAD|nr:hypothetical protein [Singulisphaera acidiphila]AGA25057.1 hypothetical protein Sinac_0642 [Singulisphaera acidiphila DSM 18658]
MGHWGVKSFENDDASDALEAGFEEVHGAVYDDLMDDRSPLTFDQVQQKLANLETLTAALAALVETVGKPFEEWDEVERLAFAGVVVRHAEVEVPIPDEARIRALDWLEHEDIDWDEATVRRLRRDKEIVLLRKAKPPES